MNIFSRIGKFFKEVRLELKKVTWPSRQETINYTLMVIGISLAVALFLGLLDFLFFWLINKFLIS
ncbi:MAG TPA: preprotein translocase subunit SecE [Candidatus Portnoybacteria bacterium]|uniref:Protein translocase subunit SecE n=1 Tax=Candidatus Portnoybacteria bacterium CG02_land_8_20_14_3_00_45_8 TaxID=1974807 RepID=A0A2M7D6G6_9BACT|nr:MAG: preprotein translocase subunit SecE [Candidatus Portnoybacteria bacterium CG02_land_8_20_14_3_00_45_8]HCX28146.1 preprotein translocase subunit SecE [Candidatus Portnoybacteria bacterium]